MPRLLRSALPSPAVYHVTARGVDGCAIALDAEDFARLVDLLRSSVRREGLDCYAYCAMTNHFHAILSGAIERVSKALHRVNGAHAQKFNARHDRRGHLFGDRFYTRLIRDDDHLWTACAYVWDNPVRAGLCASIDEWPWRGRLLRQPPPLVARARRSD